jgi:redox-regulated HSP33 family molecular chaperone
VVPFAVEPLDVRGRMARLGAWLDHILAKHAYPTPVARLVGEACVLTVLHATSLKIEGQFQLPRGDGAINMLVVPLHQSLLGLVSILAATAVARSPIPRTIRLLGLHCLRSHV